MRGTSRLRQIALIVAGTSILGGVIAGFWPVSVTVVGDTSYSCGSGFLHSRSTWKADTRALGGPEQAVGVSTATPNSSCPSKVYRHRDIGYALIGLAAVIYAALVATAAFDPDAAMPARRRRTPVTRR